MSKNLIHLSYHFIVLLLSAAIALSIPQVFSALARPGRTGEAPGAATRWDGLVDATTVKIA
jgi:hypothetical protein